MKNKSKLLGLVSAFCLVLAMGIFGVLAVTELNFNMGGSVAFDAYGINATISEGTIEGGSLTNADAGSKMQGFDVTTDMSKTQIEAQAGYNSWTGLNIAIGSTGTATLSFDVTNTSDNAEEMINIEVSATSGDSDALVITTNGVQQATTETANKTKTVIITFTVATTEINLPATSFTVSVKLSATQNPIPDASSAPVELELGSNSVTVTGNNTGSSTLVIPAYVQSGTKVIPVTRIESGAFENEYFESITIPATVVELGTDAFRDATIGTMIIDGNYDGNEISTIFEDLDHAPAVDKLILNGVVKNIGYPTKSWGTSGALSDIAVNNKAMVEYLSTNPSSWENIERLLINNNCKEYYTGNLIEISEYQKDGCTLFANQPLYEISYNSSSKTASITGVNLLLDSYKFPSQVIGTDGEIYTVTSISPFYDFSHNETISEVIVPSTVTSFGFYSINISRLVIEGNMNSLDMYQEDDVTSQGIVIKGVVKELTIDSYDSIKVESRAMLEYLSNNPTAWRRVSTFCVKKGFESYYTGTKYSKGSLSDGYYTYTRQTSIEDVYSIQYNESNKTASITAYYGDESNITVPATVSGPNGTYTVTRVTAAFTEGARVIFSGDYDYVQLCSEGQFYITGVVRQLYPSYYTVYIDSREMAQLMSDNSMSWLSIDCGDSCYLYINDDVKDAYTGYKLTEMESHNGYTQYYYWNQPIDD